MSTFKDAFDKVAEAIKDLSSLEVVTYKGTINIQGSTDVPDNFEAIISNAKAQADFKIAACTYCALDGDMRVFYDKDIGEKDMEAHQKLVETARQNRQAVVDLFKDAINKQLG